MTEYVLSLSKWICGNGSINAHFGMGKGDTQMLNDDGYMCCLGQFASQCKIDPMILKVSATPDEVATALAHENTNPIYDDSFCYRSDVYGTANTSLAETLMSINDDIDTTVPIKIYKIKEELRKHGHNLKVIA